MANIMESKPFCLVTPYKKKLIQRVSVAVIVNGKDQFLVTLGMKMN